jgi:hypothetical protein
MIIDIGVICFNFWRKELPLTVIRGGYEKKIQKKD